MHILIPDRESLPRMTSSPLRILMYNSDHRESCGEGEQWWSAASRPCDVAAGSSSSGGGSVGGGSHCQGRVVRCDDVCRHRSFMRGGGDQQQVGNEERW
jgi:hypothetical protein